MTKEVHCRDIGFDCDVVVRRETEVDLIIKVAKHAKDVHSILEVTGDMVTKVRSVIREI